MFDDIKTDKFFIFVDFDNIFYYNEGKERKYA